MAHYEECTDEECKCSEEFAKESKAHIANPALDKEWAFIQWCDVELKEEFQSRWYKSDPNNKWFTHRCVLIKDHQGPHRCNSKCGSEWLSVAETDKEQVK